MIKAVFHVYLYPREEGWGFKVPRRDITFYGIVPDDLDKDSGVLVKQGSFEVIKHKNLQFTEYKGNFYGSFDAEGVAKKDLLRVEVSMKDEEEEDED